MRLFERELDIPSGATRHRRPPAHRFAAAAGERLRPGEHPVRFVVSATDAGELPLRGRASSRPVRIGVAGRRSRRSSSSAERAAEDADQFNVVLLVPTGINASLGGHAGDAGPVARLVARCRDTLITHPNVVNGSDINEMPENCLYVEGSVICRLLMGTVGLQRVRSNRVLLVIDRHEEVAYTNAAINALNAARACYGLQCPRIVVLDPPVKLISRVHLVGPCRRAGSTTSPVFLDAIDPYAAEFDAVAVSSVIDVPPEFHQDYFDSDGDMVNPWGGVEAIFTHAAVAPAGHPLGALADDRVGGDRGGRPGRRRPADGRRGRLADLPAVDPQGTAAQPADRRPTRPRCSTPRS